MRNPIVFAALFFLLIAGSAAGQTFQPIGFAPGAASSQAVSISGDGAVVLVRDGAEATLLDAATGNRTGLGSPTIANAASLDGSVIAGGINPPEAARWAGGWQPLGFLAPPGSVPVATSMAMGISAGGGELVGFSINGSGIAEAFFWTQASGMRGLGHLGTPRFSAARALSANGTIAAGDSEYLLGLYQAFSWTAAGGMQALGFLPGDDVSRALGISADGTTIVGYSAKGTTETATMWRSGTVIDLGAPSRAFDASQNGDVIVGGSWFATSSAAWMWTAATGAQDLKTFLAAAGAPVTGWNLQVASGISDDGCTIVGWGVNPAGATEGYIVDLGPACGSGNGDLTIEKRVLLPPGATVFRRGVVTYQVRVTSSGTGPVQDFEVEDVIDSNLSLLNWAADNGIYDPANGRWRSADPMPPGTSATLLLQVAANLQALEPRVKNCAIVQWINSVLVGSAAYEACVEFDYRHVLPRFTDVHVKKAGQLVSQPTGSRIFYAVKVHNKGPSTAPSVMVGDVIGPTAGITLIGYTVTAGTYDPVLGIWDAGALGTGQSQLLELIYDVTPGFSGFVDNTVFTSSPDTEVDPSNNGAFYSIFVP